MPATRATVRTVTRWLAVTVVALPFVGLIETLQLDSSDQSPGTPSMALLIVGGFAVLPLLIPSAMIQMRAAKLMGARAKAITLLGNVSLTAVFVLLAIWGRGWLGALAAIGAVVQCVFTIVAIGRPSGIKATARARTLGDIMRMSEHGQAREALQLLNQHGVDPQHELDFLLTKTLCAYRAGAFEQCIELDLQIAGTSAPVQARVREVAAADARLSAALRDGRPVRQKELDECATAILGPGLPDGYEKVGAYTHSRALLTLAAGDAESAMRAGLDILPDQSLAPADRALVIAMVVIAAARAGYPDIARKWNTQLPDWCPLRPAVDRELGHALAHSTTADDSDCLFAD